MPDIDQYDYQRYAILFVDDEEKTRKYFKRLFGDKFRILEACDGIEALAVFRQHADEIGIIVTDQRMPNDLNLQLSQRVSVALVYLMLGCAALCAIYWRSYFLTPLFAFLFFLLSRYWMDAARPAFLVLTVLYCTVWYN